MRRVRWPLVLAGLIASTDGWGQVVDATKTGAFVGPRSGRWGLSTALSQDIGSGTWSDEDPYVAQSVRLRPGYGLTDSLSLRADAKFSWEFTSPSAPTNEDESRWATDDLFLRLVQASLLRLGAINLSGAFSAALPTSHDSRSHDYLGRLVGTVAIDAMIGEWLSVVYSFAWSEYLNQQEEPTQGSREGDYFPAPQGAGDPYRFLVACSDAADACGVSRRSDVDIDYVLRHRIGIKVWPTEDFSLAATVAFTTESRRRVGNTADNTSFDQRHQQTWILGDIRFGYRLTERWSASLGVVSEGLLSDSRGNARFPLLDFDSTGDTEILYLRGSAVY